MTEFECSGDIFDNSPAGSCTIVDEKTFESQVGCCQRRSLILPCIPVESVLNASIPPRQLEQRVCGGRFCARQFVTRSRPAQVFAFRSNRAFTTTAETIFTSISTRLRSRPRTSTSFS